MVHIKPLQPSDTDAIQQVASFLGEAFAHSAPSWIPDLDTAMEEIEESFTDGYISLTAVDETDTVLGWVGGRPDYAKVWELHPLVVRPSHQRRGIGRMLVEALEEAVRERGAITLQLGTDDEMNQTSLGGIELYPEPWEHIKNIKNLDNHPFEFYQKLGYVIVGVTPDANGLGKPDIKMAKRVGEEK